MSTRLRRFGMCLTFIGVLVFAIPVFAQINTASLTGLVTDQSNAVMTGVHVTVLDSATGYTRTVDTDSAGYYSFANLPIASYVVSVSDQGFTTLQENITLDTAERARLDFNMKVGATEQSVEVSASAPNLSRDDASIGTLIDNDTVQKTPLYLRNWDDLLRLVAGVQGSRFTQQSGATSAGRVGDFNVHGVHSLRMISSWMELTTTPFRKTFRS